MSDLTIYRASAGSGKTYTLTKEFLFLLYHNPLNYKNTLAVTFTNKATAEMKQRILEKLYLISINKSDDYVDELSEHFQISPSEVRNRAKIYLSHLLHDFSHFSVSTIDSFFQKIIRSFAREANLDSSFKIELNTDKILQKAIDHLLMKIDLPENKVLKDWLILFAEQKLNQGKHWSLKNDLQNLGKELFNESVQSSESPIHNLLKDPLTLNNYLKKMNAIVSAFEDKIVSIGTESCKAIENAGLHFEDFFYKGAGTSRYFEKLKNLNDITRDKNKRVTTLIDNPDKWGQKNNSANTAQKILDIYPLLNKNLKQALAFIDEQYELYITAKLIKQNYFSLGIIHQISEEIKQICRDENLFLIADASHFLNKIIDQNDTPFIYEKIGSHLDHYMIDEFQDTSGLQWKNFKPLIDHSLSMGGKSLVVGDVKQSIYRWRNSDWNLLNETILHDFSHQLHTLGFNFRSSSNVIKYNNTIFSDGATMLQADFNHLLLKQTAADKQYQEDFKCKITDAYNSVHQHIPANAKDSGYIKNIFIPKDKDISYVEQMMPLLSEAIFQIIEKGYEYSDICILVRKKGEGEIVAKSLLAGEYTPNHQVVPVISNESLFLSSSNAIRFIIAQIKFLQNTENLILRSEIILLKQLLEQTIDHDQHEIGKYYDEKNQHEWIDHLLTQKQKPLLELVEFLINQLPSTVKTEQSTFIQAFINCTNQFIADSYPDIAAFIDWWNEKGQSESVAIPEEQNAIKVMTIHKSKGLEYKAILIPFCNWKLDAERHSGTIWCKPELEPFSDIELLPLNYTSTLQSSIFKKEYFTELLYQHVDSLNMLYVAFTRACDILITYSEKPMDRKKDKQFSTVADMLYFAINNSGGITNNNNETISLTDHFIAEDEVFELGEIPSNNQEEKSSDIKTETLDPFYNRVIEDQEISIKKNSEQYFTSDGIVSKVDYGKIMHAAFENIYTIDDIEPSLSKLAFEGKINQKEYETLKHDIENIISQESVSEWFNPTHTIFTESEILWQSGTIRPDRIIRTPQKTIVVDYKFGDIKDEKYKDQVRFYMKQLQKMDNTNIIGYLWYVTLNQIEEVTLQPQQGTLF